MTEDEICSWLNSDASDPGLQLMSDAELCASEVVNQDDNEDDPEGTQYQFCILEKCLTWLENQPAANH